MYKFFVSRYFKRQLKPYAKKHRGLLLSIHHVLTLFQIERTVNLGMYLYKIRLPLPINNRGKSKSLRLIVYVQEDTRLLAPVTIYSKSRISNLSKRKLAKHLQRVMAELNLQSGSNPLK